MVAEPFIITIDGPAGSGKSTSAREVARRLGFAHLDSGALYRAYTFAALRLGLVRADGGVERSRLRALFAQPIEAEIRGRELRIYFQGKRLNRRLRSEEVTAAVSTVSALSEVRGKVNATLRSLARGRGGGIVCEGRDIGSQVYPKANLKIFLTADPRERARRKLRERGDGIALEAVKREARRLLARDERDARRKASPFRRPPDAVDLDTTGLSPGQQASRIVELARARGAGVS